MRGSRQRVRNVQKLYCVVKAFIQLAHKLRLALFKCHCYCIIIGAENLAAEHMEIASAAGKGWG